MGFSRNYDISDSRTTGPLFYEHMLSSGVISDKVFAVYYADTDDQSFFTLGGYDTTGTYYTGSISWIPVD